MHVAKKYIPGAIAYFDDQSPNLWMRNLDQFEAAILRGDNPKTAIHNFVTESERLLREFQTAQALGLIK